MSEQKPCRQELLDWVNVVSFAVDDSKLFLDTHPGNTDALEYLEEFLKQRTQALAEYAKYYGPLTIDSVNSAADQWKWVNGPWPWQEGGC